MSNKQKNLIEAVSTTTIPAEKAGEGAMSQHSETQKDRVKSTLMPGGNFITCRDPSLIVILQQYLKYVKGYKDISIDGKLGGETLGYYRAASGKKSTFNDVRAYPTLFCEEILYPDGLTKVAKVSTFDALKQLIQSKMPAGQKVGVIPKVVPKVTKTSQIDKNPYKNYRAYVFTAIPTDIQQSLKALYPTFKKTSEGEQFAVIRTKQDGTGWILTLDDAQYEIRQDIAKALDKFSGLKESWSIKNKNKYTQNLFERLIKDISKGNK